MRTLSGAVLGAIVSVLVSPAVAQDYLAPKEGAFIAKDFKFNTGEVMPEMRIAYTTIGDPAGQPVLVLHGTTGSAASLLTPAFAGELFGPGQPLDATKYYIVIPDSVGDEIEASMAGGKSWEDAVAQANHEPLAPLECLGHAGEHSRRCRVVAFDQDLVEPIERQAGQDRHDAAGMRDMGPA